MAVTKIGTANLAEYFSSDAYMKRPRKGFVTSLAQEMPNLMYGPTNYFDFSYETSGKFVGESESKDGEGNAFPRRQVRTEKVVYDERISVEMYNQLEENGELENYIQTMANKFMASDLERDLDKLALYGKINPTGTRYIDNYITKTGQAILVPSTGSSAAAIKADLMTAVEATDADGVALSRTAAKELASIREAGVQVFPELGIFGADAVSIGGLRAAVSNAFGTIGTGNETLVAGDFRALRWGIVAEANINLLDAGNPDGNGDLGNLNEYLIRMEVFLGIGIASPTALAYVANV